MPFTQETFFGASIRGWQSSLDWEGSPASCTVNVVVDNLNGDSFITPIAGMPATFQYQSWYFSGIVQSFRRTNSSQANPEYEIRLTDAREILDNAKVIVGSYTGGVLGVPNLYNVYGLYESTGYGNSGWNEAGMPWANVRAGLLSLVNGGSPLQFRGYSYLLDLSALPAMPADYRISGPSLSILEYISQVCQDGGHDFFINLVGNVITVRTLSRVNTPASLNEINTFVTLVGGQISSEAGREVRNETTSKMVIGGQRIDMWFQPYNGGAAANASIWPFWGFAPQAVNGGQYFVPILATGFNDDHNFSVDLSHLGLPGLGYYNINVRELRAAGESYNDWLFYMQGWKAGILATITGGASTSNIGLINILRSGSIGAIRNIATVELQHNLSNRQPVASGLVGGGGALAEQNQQKLYRYISAYANDYYGRQFMVALPSVGVRFNGSEYDMTREPEPAAWYDESIFGSYLVAAAAGYLPFDFNSATQGDGRFVCMVRIQNIANYDYDDIPLEALVQSGNNMFVKCEVVGITFLDPVLMTYPRAVVRLPGPIRRRADFEVNTIYLINALIEENQVMSVAEKFEARRHIMRQVSSLDFPPAVTPGAVMPDLALVPLRNKQYTYGPWVAIGTAGRVEVEINDDLVPWNYGGTTPMNQIGSAMVASAVTNMQEAETGYVEFPGVPAVVLGAPLVAGGPFVTGVSVSIGESGATTRYTMKTWTPKFGQIAKTQLVSMQRMIKQQQSFRIQLRNKITDILRSPQFSRPRQLTRNPALRQNSAHVWAVADAFEYIDGFGYSHVKNPVGLVDTAAGCGQTALDADKKAAVSLDGIFRPFKKTPGTANLIPGPESPTSPESPNIVPTTTQLNPFLTNFGILGGQTDGGTVYGTADRFVGMRGPIMMVGWGRDTTGLPTPNAYDEAGEDETEHSLNYQSRSDKWRVGPLDMRWDEDRKVWVSDHQHLEGFLDNDLFANSSATMEVYRRNRQNQWTTTGEHINVVNRSETDFAAGSFMVAIKINREWRPVTCCSDGETGERCYEGMGDTVDYEDFECLNEWVDDPEAPGGRRAPTEEDSPEDIHEQNFTCVDDYMDKFEFVTDVFCVEDDIVVCTRQVCLPHSWVSVDSCGDAVPPHQLPCTDIPLATTLNGTMQHSDGHNIIPALTPDAGSFTWTWNERVEKYVATFRYTKYEGNEEEGTEDCEGGEGVLSLTARCDEEGKWQLTVGDACLGEMGSVTTPTDNVPEIADGTQVAWANITIPNCTVNAIKGFNCSNLNTEPPRVGPTRVQITLEIQVV